MHPVELTWAGGEHRFLLTIGLLRALQDKCDAGPEWILNRLRTGQWRVDDIVQTIRLGLEGGGLSKDEARRLATTHVEERPLTLSVLTAQLVLAASLYDMSDDPVGEAQAGAETTPPLSPEADGDLVGSTAPA
jgi:hypothetical protein